MLMPVWHYLWACTAHDARDKLQASGSRLSRQVQCTFVLVLAHAAALLFRAVNIA